MRDLSNLVPKTFPMRCLAASRRSCTFTVCSAALLLGAVAGAVGADDVSARIASARLNDEQGLWKAAPIVVFAIPAISAQPRLPDRLPTDGRVAGALDLVLTPGESEPVSFYVFAADLVEAFVVRAGELKGNGLALSASCLDVKSVGCWPQAMGAWHVHDRIAVGDSVVPELLLNDVRVAESPVPIADAAAPVPTPIAKGRGRQFWVTLHAPRDAKPGIYAADLALETNGRSLGSLRLNVRVLPFTLPAPRTRYDRAKPFHTVIGHGGDPELLRRRGDAADLLRHQISGVAASTFAEAAALSSAAAPMRPVWLTAPGELARAAGLGGGAEFAGWTTASVSAALAEAERTLKHRDVRFFVPGDLPGGVDARIAAAQAIRAAGGGVWSLGDGADFEKTGYGIDAQVLAGPPDRRTASRWHLIGRELLGCMPPHPGAENPERWRRTKGLLPYWADYDGVVVPGLLDAQQPWRDPAEERRRSRSLVYEAGGRWIDTLAWEAVREAVDDVRYFTLLAELSHEASDSARPETVAEGRKASQWFELVNTESVDLDTLRLETIAWILKLQSVVEAGKGVRP